MRHGLLCSDSTPNSFISRMDANALLCAQNTAATPRAEAAASYAAVSE